MIQRELSVDAACTTVSTEYVPRWAVVDALREVIQEDFDARDKFGCRVPFRFRNGTALASGAYLGSAFIEGRVQNV